MFFPWRDGSWQQQTKPSRPGRPRGHFFRPRLELLESRTLLNAGLLDPTFGTGGKVTTHFMGNGGASGGALQSDGKIVVVGSTRALLPGTKSHFVVARYNPDGSLDTTFGTGGTVTTDFGGNDAASDVVIQPDGKIVVVGSSVDVAQVTSDLARYQPNGSLDLSFGRGGTIRRDGGEATGVALQPDGKILVSELIGVHTKFSYLTRYNPDGSVDTSFGSGIPPSGAIIGVQADGRIILAVNGGDGINLVRFFPNGDRDPSFGMGGKATTPGAFVAYGFTLRPDGRIVVAGAANDRGNINFALLQYNVNGNLDPTFGAGGKVLTNFGQGQGVQTSSLALQPDGKIVVAGSTQGASNRFALARYDPDGALDVSFGSGGTVVTDFGGTARASRVVVQPDGKSVAVGNANGDFALARYSKDDPYPTRNQAFVAQVYLDLLRRSVDPVGLAGWSGLLDQGTPRAQVALAIETSPEYRALVVQNVYGVFLHRAADPGGLSGSIGFLAAGGTVERLEAAVAGSPEYFQVRGGGTRDGFLDALYQDALNRPVDPTGRTGFDQNLAAGATPNQVAGAVLTSVDDFQDLVQSFYQRFLRRPADPAGLNAFVTALQRGARDEQIIATVVGSDEYFSRLPR
jgi:uncharacterized delta-60 repeat protein